MKLRLALVATLLLAVTILVTTAYCVEIVQGDILLNETFTVYEKSLLVNGDMICRFPNTIINMTHANLTVTGNILCSIYNVSTGLVDVEGVGSTVYGVLSDLYAEDNLYFKVEAANSSGTYTAGIRLLFTMSREFVNRSENLYAIVTIVGNSSINPDIDAGIYVFNVCNGEYVKIGVLNSTEKTKVTILLPTLKCLVNQSGFINIFVNMTDDRNIPFTVTLDYADVRVYSPTKPKIYLDRSTLEVRGGEITNGYVEVKHSHVIIENRLTVVNSSVYVEKSLIEGTIDMFNSTLVNVYGKFTNMTCEGCVVGGPTCKILNISTRLVKVRRYFEHESKKYVEVDLEAPPGINFTITLETPWCLDNKTVIILPNGTILNVNTCRINLFLKAVQKTLRLVIMHGVYERGVLLHVGNPNATIVNMTILPRRGMICNLTVDAPSGTRSIIVINNVSKPARIFLNGVDVTAYYTENIKNCTEKVCWHYNTTAREVLINVSHLSPITVTVYSTTLSFSVNVEGNILKVRIYNPYDYDEYFTIKITYYRFWMEAGRDEKYVLVPPNTTREYTFSIPSAVSDIKVEIYDVNNVKIYEQKMTITWTYLSTILLPLVIAVIIMLVLLTRKKTIIVKDERKKMFRLSQS